MSEILTSDGLVIVKPGEDIVASMAGGLREELKDLVAKQKGDLILDLTGVEMI